MLVDFALSQAVELGVGTLHLEVEHDNERAGRLYREAGFKETGRKLMHLGITSLEPNAPARASYERPAKAAQ